MIIGGGGGAGPGPGYIIPLPGDSLRWALFTPILLPAKLWDRIWNITRDLVMTAHTVYFT